MSNANTFELKHPCLHERQHLTVFDRIRLTLNYITAPICWPTRLVVFVVLMLLNSLAGTIINIGTDKAHPMAPWRRSVLKFFNAIFLYPALLCCGFALSVEDRRKTKLKKCELILCNHHSMTDILALGAVGTDCMIANKAVTNNVFCRPQMRASRSLCPGGGCVDEMKRRKDEGGWPVFTVFADGGICPEGLVLRPKIGCLRLLKPGDFVEPISIRYYTPHCTSWLLQSVKWVGLQLLKNCFRKVKVVYLEPIKYNGEDLQQFADKIYMAIAKSQGELFEPYGIYENRWFEALPGYESEKLHPDFVKRYAWMGNNKQYRALCAKAGKDPNYEWTAKELGLE